MAWKRPSQPSASSSSRVSRSGLLVQMASATPRAASASSAASSRRVERGCRRRYWRHNNRGRADSPARPAPRSPRRSRPAPLRSSARAPWPTRWRDRLAGTSARPPEPASVMVERGGEIGRGVGERAVEIERDHVEGEVGHRPSGCRAAAMEMARFPCDRARGPGAMTSRDHSPPSILAAGKGTRMKSDLHKVLHPIAGRPMLAHLLDSVEALGPRARPSSSSAAAASRSRPLVEARGGEIVVQERQLGTGHAVLQAEDALAGFDGDVLILYGDTPLVEAATMRADARAAPRAGRAGRGRGRLPARRSAPLWPDHRRAPTARSRRWSNIRMRPPEERAVDLCNSRPDGGRAADLSRCWRGSATPMRPANIICPTSSCSPPRTAAIGGDRGRRRGNRRGQQPRRARGGRGGMAAPAPRPRRWPTAPRWSRRKRSGSRTIPRSAATRDRAQCRVRPRRHDRRQRRDPGLQPYRGRDDRDGRGDRSLCAAPARRRDRRGGARSAISSRSRRRSSARAPRPTTSPISATPRWARAPMSAPARSPAIMTAISIAQHEHRDVVALRDPAR